MSTDETVPVKSDDPEMIEAINTARASLGEFISAFLNPAPSQKSFLLKIEFDHEGQVEHIWMADLDLASSPPTGVIANEPALPGYRFMERRPFALSDVTDWMFIEDEALIGGFTTKLLQRRQRPN